MLLTAAIGVIILLTTAGLQVGAASAAAHRARAAADLAALAAASAVQEGVGEPCARAAALAERNDAQLLDCHVGDGESVRLRVVTKLAVSWPGVPDAAVASARAGPDEQAG